MNLRRAAVFFPLFFLTAAFGTRLLGCSPQADAPLVGDTDASISHVEAVACSTPAQGCACGTVGSTAACGRVNTTSDGFDQCSYGRYTCTDAGSWSACEGLVRVQSLLATPGARLNAQNLQLDASSCGDADPCDPYCTGYTDTPTGISSLPPGLTISDGGLAVAPTVDGGSVPSVLQTTGSGLSSCGPALNPVGGCSSPGPSACAQDFRCDTGSHTCVWNGGEGYHDNTVGGADLTIGAGCDYGGTTTFPVCNRGSAAVTAGTALNVAFVPGNSAPSGCTSAPTSCSAVAPPGGLVPGDCLNIPCAIDAGGAGFAVVNAGDPSNLEATGYCQNNIAFAQTRNGADTSCASCTYCDTRVTGQVWDPGHNVGLRDMTVYELAGTNNVPPPLPDNVGGSSYPPCDSCDTLLPPSLYSVGDNTDKYGHFDLEDVTPGPSQTIVAQSGRWRRYKTGPITACANNVIADSDISMPATQMPAGPTGGGDIPKIGFVMGGAEQLECWMLKMGISPSEMKPYASSGSNPQRVQLFKAAHSNGQTLAYNGSPALLDENSLWNGGVLNDYTALVMSCNGEGESESSGAMSALSAYADHGGRVFMDHFWGETWLTENGSPWISTDIATWETPFNNATIAKPAIGKVEHGTTAQAHMYEWLNQWVGGSVQSANPKDDAVSAGAASTTWIRGDTSNTFGATHPNGDYTLSFSFETPVNQTATCGRVLFNGMHASATRLKPECNFGSYYCDPFHFCTSVCTTNSPRVFPDDCDLGPGLTSEEEALEYQLFQVTACALGGAPPPSPPPPPPALATALFYRDFYATCGDGLQLVWQAFNWDADIPDGTRIQYFAATSNDEASLPTSVTAPPATVPIGQSVMTTLAPYWGTDANTVDWHLRNDAPGPAQISESWLRVYMVFEPTATTSPTLYDWQQLYDCVPNQ